MAEFLLRCTLCGCEYEGSDGFRLRCKNDLNGAHGPALLRAKYERSQIEVRGDLPGIFKYSDWLPTGRYFLKTRFGHLGQPYCYRSAKLARRLGLTNLFIAFSGYWPGRQANLVTRTFKEFEVQASIVCILQATMGKAVAPLIISSAGNTGNSYNYYTHLAGLPLFLVVPESGLGNLLLPFETNPVLIAVDGDYTDAIEIADQIAERGGFSRDGGVFNPGRRGGMATAMLNAVCHPEQGSQRLFDHYFQAVGSGSGAIAAWEAVQLLRADGRFGETNTKIHMAQNAPFVPIANAWRAKQRELAPLKDELTYDQIAAVTAGVLTNRRPPYAVAGGLWDVLSDTDGATWEVSNERVFHAARMFYALEGVDIGPAAAVALDALVQAIKSDDVQPDDYVLLHVTGGGREIQYSEGQVFQPRPTIKVKAGRFDDALAAVGSPRSMDPDFLAGTLARY